MIERVPDGVNPFARHGRLKVSANGRHLEHADGTPFFYLADTAWNGALLSSDADWRAYLADRRAKGFTAIQFILMAPWAGAYCDAEGRRAFEDNGMFGEVSINADFFRRMDERVEAIGEAGLLAVPVLAWAAKFGESAKHNPGVSLSMGAMEKLVEHQVSRYGANHLLWLLAGDGRYGGLRSWKWKWIGRKVFGHEQSLVGLHPMGGTWPYESFKGEGWLKVLGYQSGHSEHPEMQKWLRCGPPAKSWELDRRMAINLEPCYEGLHNWIKGKPFTNADVRRAMYASLLNAPTAGVAYGAHGVWSWERAAREPLNHQGTGVAMAWHKAAQLPGSFDAARLAVLFGSIDWWRLRPAQALLAAQPGDEDISRFVSASASEAGDLAVLYLPRGGEVCLQTAGLRVKGVSWFDPRNGTWLKSELSANGLASAPDEEDWVLILKG